MIILIGARSHNINNRRAQETAESQEVLNSHLSRARSLPVTHALINPPSRSGKSKRKQTPLITCILGPTNGFCGDSGM